MSVEVKEQMDEIKKLVATIQSENEAKVSEYGADIAKNDTAIVKMTETIGGFAEKFQKQEDEAKSQAKTITDLTLSLAKAAGRINGKDGEIEMSDDVKSMFTDALSIQGSKHIVDRIIMAEIVTSHVEKSFSHLSGEKKEHAIKSILAEGSNPAGGMWCPVPTDSRIRQRVWETSPMRQMAEVINVNTKAMKFALDDEDIIAQETGEVDVRNPTDVPEFGEVRIDIHELSAKPQATLDVLEDSTMNLDAWLSGKVSSRFARQENEAFINGNGIKTARGILDYQDTDVEVYKRDAIGTAITAASLTIDGDDLISVQANLLEDFQSNATWLMHRLIWADITKLKDTTGQYLLNPMQLFQGSVLTLLGAPVRMAGDMPSPTAGALVGGVNYIAYGDFREGYTILDRLGINVIMDNITRSGFINWYYRARYGGGVTNFQAFKRLQAKS